MSDIPPETLAEIDAKLAEDWEASEDGWTTDGGYDRPIWSAAGFLARGDRYLIICGCGVQRDAPLADVVAAGLGNRPMHVLKWKPCEACGSTAFSFDHIDGPRPTLEEELAEDENDPDGYAVELPSHLAASEEDDP